MGEPGQQQGSGNIADNLAGKNGDKLFPPGHNIFQKTAELLYSSHIPNKDKEKKKGAKQGIVNPLKDGSILY